MQNEKAGILRKPNWTESVGVCEFVDWCHKDWDGINRARAFRSILCGYWEYEIMKHSWSGG